MFASHGSLWECRDNPYLPQSRLTTAGTKPVTKQRGYNYRNKPHLTTIGLSAVRRAWPSSIIEDESKSMLVAQSLRNTIMGSILPAVVAITLISSLAAFTNNSYNARNVLNSPIFGSQAIGLRDLKYSAATVSLIASFLFSSIAVGCFVEAQFLPSFPKLQDGCLHFFACLLLYYFMHVVLLAFSCSIPASPSNLSVFLVFSGQASLPLCQFVHS
ncbi:hypothetical protein Sjap_002454 [Stephania japonica]|uniref:Uncharacterized protein n=1 Tax=Stephania japonica TaxID=461633 RepID=A0AAP0PUJ7_9MAGN